MTERGTRLTWTNLKINEALRAADLGDWLVAGSKAEVFVEGDLLVFFVGSPDRLRMWTLDVEDYEEWVDGERRRALPAQEVLLFGRGATLAVLDAAIRFCLGGDGPIEEPCTCGFEPETSEED